MLYVYLWMLGVKEIVLLPCLRRFLGGLGGVGVLVVPVVHGGLVLGVCQLLSWLSQEVTLGGMRVGIVYTRVPWVH